MTSRGRGARMKGASFERELAKYISEKTGLEAKRGLGQARVGGSEIADVEVEYIHVEAKRQIKCNIKAAMRQAIEDCALKNKLPAAITKDDRDQALVTMRLDDWIELFKAYIEVKEKQKMKTLEKGEKT